MTVARIDPQNFSTFLQALVEVQGGGIRTIKVALPEATGTALRFECSGPRIVEQKAAPPVNGERVWTLQFDQRLRGQALIVCDVEMPRGEVNEFIVPQWRFVDAERQNGFFAVEAGGEQRLTIVAKNADGSAIPDVDALDLPTVYYQPKERLVAVYRAAAAGTVLTLSEQKFEKLPVPTAICPLLEISTIVGQTGELQHRATFHLQVVGVQGLHVTFPAGTTLWATLVDGRPVEVRRSGDVYLIPFTLPTSVNDPLKLNLPPSGFRTAQFFYRSEVPALSQFGTLKQEAPSLTVESGQRTALPVEVLERKWDVHYPEETRLVDSRSPLEPDQPLDRMSLLGNWNSTFQAPTPADFGWQLMAVVVAIVIVALLGYGHRQNRLIVTQVVVVILVFGILFAMLLPAVQQSREAARRTQSKNNLKQIGLAMHNYLEATSSELSSNDDFASNLAPQSGENIPNLKYHSEPESDVRKKHSYDDKSPPGSDEKSMPVFKLKPGTIPFPVSKSENAPVGGPAGLKSHTVRNVQPREYAAPWAGDRLMVHGPGVMAPLGQTTRHDNAPGAKFNNPVDPLADNMNAANDQAVAQQALGGFDGDVEAADGKLGEGKVGGNQTLSLLGLLSLAIEFQPPAGTRQKMFHYVGADASPADVALEVDYVDRRSGAAIRIFVMALVAMTGWLLRKGCGRSKIAMATFGIVVSLALMPLVPTTWQVILDGVFLGTLVAVVLWLIRTCTLCCPRCCSFSVKAKTVQVCVTLATLLSLTDSVFAEEKQAAPNAKPMTDPRPATTLVIPFDAGAEPLASERVFLSHEQFLQLYRLANPDKVARQQAPQSGGILEALYAAKLVPNAKHPEESTVHVTARFAVRSFVDGQLLVELPIGQTSPREVKLDGQAAALITNAGSFKVAVSKPGLHVIDFEFDMPARLSGSTGSFSLSLLPVPTGKLTFELPAKDLSVRVNGSSTIFRRVTDDNVQSLEFPVDKGGDISIAWQPQQAIGAAAAVVHVDSVEAMTLTDAGVAVSQGFSYRVRQGQIADTAFSLPDNLRLQAVTGPDVGGWELQGEGAARKLRVIFRRNVTDETRLTVETFLDVKVGTASTVIQVPQIAPQEITNEIGLVAVFAGNQFTIRAEQVESLSQIDSDKFATQIPVSRPNVPPQLAYRFSKRPFTLSLRAIRQESQAHVTAQQAAFIALRKEQLTTRLRFNLTGAPRSSLSVTLPENFVLLDVQATALRDWYVTKQQDGSTLTVDLSSPRLGLIEVVIGGFRPRDGGAVAITVSSASRCDTSRFERGRLAG